MALFDLPPDIDQDIRALVEANPRLTINLVVRDIVRIKLIFHLVETKQLNDDTVLCGGMAMRCYGSSRMTVRDTDTSTKLELDRGMFAEAMAYEDDDVRITPQGVEEGRELFSVKPIDYDPYFTRNTWPCCIGSPPRSPFGSACTPHLHSADGADSRRPPHSVAGRGRPSARRHPGERRRP